MKGFFSKIGKQKFIALAAVAMLLVAAIAITVGVTLIRSDNSEEPYTVSNYGTIQGKFTDISINNEENAIEAVRDAAEILGLGNAAEELTVNRTDTVDNLTYYHLDQNYKGIPVYGSSFVVVTDENGEALCLTGNAKDIDEKISLIPTATQDQINAAINATFEEAGETVIPEVSDDMLVVYNLDETNGAVLAYQFYVEKDGMPYNFVVGAENGEVIVFSPLFYNDSENSKTKIFLYDANNKNIAVGVKILLEGNEYVYSIKKKGFFDKNGNNINDIIIKNNYDNLEKYKIFHTIKSDGELLNGYSSIEIINQDKEAKKLYDRIVLCENFFAKVLNRKGYDDNYGIINSVYNVFTLNDLGLNSYSQTMYYLEGAATNSTVIAIGSLEGYGIDLIAHEYTHSVEQTISQMQYSGETGAIMEGYSDVFGELIEDWENDGFDNDCDWNNGNRNIKNPIDSNNPASYRDFYWNSPIIYKDDNGQVHHNSTVISHLAYNMINSMLEYTALSNRDIAKLWYQTLFLLPTDCNFEELRLYMEMSADMIGLSERKQQRISLAFDMANIKSNDKSIFEDFNLTIKCVNDPDYYKNCKVLVNGFKDSDKDREIHRTIDLTGEKTKVHLDKGEYTIKVYDNNTGELLFIRDILIRKNFWTSNNILFIIDETNEQTSEISETTLTPETTIIPEETTSPIPETTEIPETLPPMEQLFTVTGKVVKFDGKTPHVGATVNISNDLFEAKGVVDNNGYFSVEVPNGDYRFSITAQESADNKYTFISGWGDNCCHVADSGVNLGTFKISTVLRGMVTEGTPGSENYGKPLEGVKVSVLTSNEQKIIGESFASNYYDSSGNKSNYGITCNSPGTYDLIFSKEGYQDFVIENYVVDIFSSKIPEVFLINTDSETTEHVHTYTSTDNTASCTEEVKIIHTCQCGDSYTEILPMIEHNFVNNVCSMCGYVLVNSSNGLEIKVYKTYCEIIGIGICKDKNIVLPDTYQGLPVTMLSDEVFYNCDFIESVYIPASIIEITGSRFTNSPFRNCPNLESIEVDPENTVFHSSGNCLIITERKLLIAGCKNSILPNDGSVKTLGFTAFMGCNIERVIIPDSVTVVGMSAFYKCNNLKYLYLTANSMNTLDAPIFLNRFSSCPIKEVVIADDFTDLEKLDFNTLKSLTVITLGKGISVIKSNDFYRVSELTTLNLNNTIEKIEENAFVSCSNLTAINFNGTLEQWEAINKNNGWDSGIGNYTVYCLDGKIKK